MQYNKEASLILGIEWQIDDRRLIDWLIDYVSY